MGKDIAGIIISFLESLFKFYSGRVFALSLIKNESLAPKGMEKILWVREHMPVLRELQKRYGENKPFRDLNIAICIHLEAKTAFMALMLQEAGAKVVITGSNPLSTQDDVAAALHSEGIEVYAWHDASAEEYEEHLYLTASKKPHLIIDDGGDLVSLLHKNFQDRIPRVIGGAEETTTGLIRLRAMEKNKILGFPMIAVNDARCKYLFDNRYGTGQSVWDGIMRTSNLIVAGKNVVVAGYGWCGKGVAMRAKGLGARVIVCEIDPVKALEAHMDGFQVMPLAKAASQGDIFITVTGCSKVFTGEHFAVMKDKAILANAGHFDIEIDKKALASLTDGPHRVRKNIDAYYFKDGRCIYLLGEGRLVNLAAADGHPAEIMDMSFALQVLALNYLLQNKSRLEKKVLSLPPELDRDVAWLKLEGIGLKIDSLTAEQKNYLESWEVNS
ncbi:MAG: adenosylhomocysteinase [Firmicutes bacterium]|nr:adenosylhomocysteinase [Bacillota bacterium]